MASERDPFDFSRYAQGAPPNVGPPAPPTGLPGAGAPPFGAPARPTAPYSFAGRQPPSMSPPGFAGGVVIGQPPLWWLFAGLAAASGGAALALFLGGSATLAFVSWAMAGPVAIGLLAVFAARDTDQRARPVYVAPAWAATVYWSVLVVAVLGIALSALRIANWAGRL